MVDKAFSAITTLVSLGIDLVAVALAIARWSRHPVVSMLVLVATVLHLTVRGAYLVAPMVLHGLGRGNADLMWMYFGGSLLGAAASGLIIAAVFIERPEQSRQPPMRES
jgi:hypothetical protein